MMLPALVRALKSCTAKSRGSSRDNSRLAALLLSGACLGLSVTLGCGGTEVEPKTVQDAKPVVEKEFDHLYGMRASAEIGALDEDAVEDTFSKSLGELQECLNEGAQRLEFIGGSVGFFIKIDSGGALSHAHVENCTLGDRETEVCMLGVLKAKRWPKPVGGESGIARKSFDFDAAPDVRAPTEWSTDQARPVISEIRSRSQRCKHGSDGKYAATVYVGTDGNVLSAGVSPPDESGEANVDCLLEAIRAAHFQSPGSWPAKLQFQL